MMYPTAACSEQRLGRHAIHLYEESKKGRYISVTLFQSLNASDPNTR